MIFRRKTYHINPEKLEVFTDFFHRYLYPNQIKQGARLIGRWATESKDEVLALWQYESMAEYERIEELVRQDPLHKLAQEKRKELGNLIIESKQDFLTMTGEYHRPPYNVGVNGFILNEDNEILLVRNHHRSDTMEIPGGLVEELESLEDAVKREVFEETGVEIELLGITGVYQNVSLNIVSIVFAGKYVSGTPRIAEGETMEVCFKKLDANNIDQWVTRPNFKKRILDALACERYVAHEAYKDYNPFEVVSRYEAITVQE